MFVDAYGLTVSQLRCLKAFLVSHDELPLKAGNFILRFSAPVDAAVANPEVRAAALL